VLTLRDGGVAALTMFTPPSGHALFEAVGRPLAAP
jgi:hypothetical protein